MEAALDNEGKRKRLSKKPPVNHTSDDLPVSSVSTDPKYEIGQQAAGLLSPPPQAWSHGHDRRNPPKGQLMTFLEYWWKSTFLLGIMVASLTAIIITLSRYQGRPLPNWPLSITLNSFISIMAVVLKAAMLAAIAEGLHETKWIWFKTPRPLSDYPKYDHASQGVFGAAELLWVLRARQALPSIALLTIMAAIAIDPFTQQVIQYREVTEASPEASLASPNPTLPRSNAYNDFGSRWGPGLYNLNPRMVGAILTGFWSPELVAQSGIPVANCTTGECTFADPYHTLAICSACENRTAELTGVEDDGRFNYSLPSGTTLSMFGGASSGILSTLLVGMQPANWSLFGVGSDTNYFASREYIWTDKHARCKFPSCLTLPCRGTECENMHAAACYLYPCVNTYTGFVTGNRLTETLVSSAPIPVGVTTSNGFACGTGLRKDCPAPHEWDTVLTPQGYRPSDNPGSEYLSFCTRKNNGLGWHRQLNLSNACVYDFDSMAHDSLASWWRSSPVMTGSIRRDNYTSIEADDDMSQLYYHGWPGATEGRFLDTLTLAFWNVSQAMTARVRQDGRANYSEAVAGRMLFTRTIIEVQWQWLAMPGALVLLTLWFVVAAAVYTAGNLARHRQLGDALLLYGVSGRSVDAGAGCLVPEGEDMGRGAEGKAWVQVTETEGGVYRLKRV